MGQAGGARMATAGPVRARMSRTDACRARRGRDDMAWVGVPHAAGEGPRPAAVPITGSVLARRDRAQAGLPAAAGRAGRAG